jgi:hypothetical protein
VFTKDHNLDTVLNMPIFLLMDALISHDICIFLVSKLQSCLDFAYDLRSIYVYFTAPIIFNKQL